MICGPRTEPLQSEAVPADHLGPPGYALTYVGGRPVHIRWSGRV